jgi:MFS family permease
MIGAVVSIHMAGMYLLSPCFAYLLKRFGGSPVLIGALAMLAVTLVSAPLIDSPLLVTVRLFLVGVAWSATQFVSTIRFSEVDAASNPKTIRVQGTLDFAGSLAGGCGIAFAGLLQSLAQFSTVQGAYGLLALVSLLGVATHVLHRRRIH